MRLLEEAAARLEGARRITALTGAGVSAASGVPTFRGPGGLWRAYRPEDLATPEAFARDPRLVWEWYDWRRARIAACEPNAAHHVLAAWAVRDGFTLVTQNVDGLHERAMEMARLTPDPTATEAFSRTAPGRSTPAATGFSRSLIRMHGSIWDLQCLGRCGAVWRDLTVPLRELPPRCGQCGAIARPGVVWFGEALDPNVLARCDRALDCDVFLSIGTSSVVYPAAGLVHEARRRGAFTVEINPEATAASGAVDLPIASRAEEALPGIDALLERPT